MQNLHSTSPIQRLLLPFLFAVILVVLSCLNPGEAHAQSLNCNTSGFSCNEIMGGVPRTESRCAGINNQEIQEQAWSGWRCTVSGTCQKVPADPPGWITEDICSSGTQCTTNPPPAHCVAVDGGGGGSTPPPPTGDDGPGRIVARKGGNGAGSVTGTSPGYSNVISCGSSCSQDSFDGDDGDSYHVDLTANPSSGSTFTGWSVSPSVRVISGCGSSSSCRVQVYYEQTTTATANFAAAAAPTFNLNLSVSPSSRTGTTDTIFTFTPVPSGTATGTITYDRETCNPRAGGVLVSGPNRAGVFSCRFSSTGSGKTVSIRGERQNIYDIGSTSVSVVSAAPPTFSLGLNVSDSTPYIGQRITFTPISSGTATGPISYSNATCGTGGVRNSFNSTTGVFDCTYSSIGQRSGRITGVRSAISRTATRSVTVAAPPAGFSITLNASPGSGTVNETTFRFTPTEHNLPALYTTTYSNPSCGSGAAPTSFSSANGTFRCTYSSAGTKTARVNVEATRLLSPRLTNSATVNVAVVAEEEEIPEDPCVTNPTAPGCPGEPPPPPPPPPPVDADARLSANPTTIQRGDSSRLTWSSGAGACVGTNFNTGSRASGFTLVSPEETTQYRVNCSGLNGGSSDTSPWVTVTVTDPAIESVDVGIEDGSPLWVPRGGSTTIEWTISPPDAGNTAVCTVLGVPGGGPFNYTSRRTFDVSDIQQATEYTVRCSNDAPSTEEGEITVFVLPTYGEF